MNLIALYDYFRVLTVLFGLCFIIIINIQEWMIDDWCVSHQCVSTTKFCEDAVPSPIYHWTSLHQLSITCKDAAVIKQLADFTKCVRYILNQAWTITGVIAVLLVLIGLCFNPIQLAKGVDKSRAEAE
jgi:hypothetical protein